VPTPAQPLTSVAQDYLKVIWSAGEWSDAQVTTNLLARRLGVGASTVSETVRRLVDQGLVDHPPYGAVTLTGAGRSHAVAMVRRHRLIETFLVERLGYTWDEVHEEAEVLEHAVSDLMVQRIDDALGRPARDPHGDPIPSVDGTVRMPSARRLWDLTSGRGTVARISDADPVLLRYFAEVGLGLDATVVVRERRDAVGVISIQVDGRDVELGEVAACAVWIVSA
jgi:DtxR family Mn-dependent transcriptional regulator